MPLIFSFGFEIGPTDLQTLPGNCDIGGRMGPMCGIGGTFTGSERADVDTRYHAFLSR